ncbi:MAG TPA: tRNA 2-thiouridine(34) synthase MnmA [Solirubrobacteraceae bacterium]|jgi:tRNA-specific 2-thiouridylase|nr:tRNA 2-thiouridine(34) synthase MnmA [Solirubrobacteraceae bacterium]
MPDERFEDHLRHPRGRGRELSGAHHGAAGGAACGDLVRLSVAVEGARVAAVAFEAAGCGATIAAASAAVELAEGAGLLEAARIGAPQIAAELGGLSAGKLHAADLASDALHRALGAAVRAHGRLEARPGRTLVAMSGGVDSAVAALLSAEEPGCEVVAVTLELWADPENDGERSCCSAAAVRGARRVAHGLGLAHFTLDLRDEFRAGVVAPWLSEHADGQTPNPCVRCNGHVRLDAMLAFGASLGAATLTTGHYARRTPEGLLRLAADPAKDQTYMLAALSRTALARLRFPLGELTKPQVRALAVRAGLDIANKPDSQDLCFLAGTGRASFLARHGGMHDRPGDIVDRAGAVVGRHDGHHGFTVGQRRGLGGGSLQPLYVLATDARANTVTVGPRAELATRTVRVRGLRMHGATPDAVRLRYRSPAVGCRLEGDAVLLDEPFDGAAPGQTAVFLAGDAIVGCATIAA